MSPNESAHDDKPAKESLATRTQSLLKRWRLWVVLVVAVLLLVAVVPVSRSLMVSHAKRIQKGGSVIKPEYTKWLKRAESLGSPEASYLLARVIDQPDHPCVTPEVVAEYSIAAHKGFAPAQGRLGFLYLKGDGVAQNVQKAAALAQQSADANDPDGLWLLARLTMDGKGVEKNVQKALALYRKATERGSTTAMLAMYLTYTLGVEVEQSETEAIRYLVMLAEAGDPNGLRLLAGRYEGGDGVPRDASKARDLLLKGAQKNDPQCQYQLARLLTYGAGPVQANREEAMKWLRVSAEAGCSQAEFMLGMVLGEGKMLPMDFSASLKWIRKAAEDGFPPAQTKLGQFYLRGFLVERDANLACEWLSKASDAGNGDAKTLLEEAKAARDRAAAEQSGGCPVEIKELYMGTNTYGFPRVVGVIRNPSPKRIVAVLNIKLSRPDGIRLGNVSPTVVLDPGETGRFEEAIASSWGNAKIWLEGIRYHF